MNIHEKFGLTRVINARGTYTPLGVSRSSAQVGHVVAQALSEYFIIDELQDVLSRTIAADCGAEAGAATHCVSAAITLSVAAAMTADAPLAVTALPDTTGLPNRVVIPAGHVVNYGHSILSDIRLAGAKPIVAGGEAACLTQDLDFALEHDRTACLLLVSSRLVKGQPLDLAEAVAAAHRRGVPAIIDGAAQDMRIGALLATGADIVLISAHKYLASPTAGIVAGRSKFVQAFRAQEQGIGRAMKPSKEAILGVLTAMEERRQLDPESWRAEQAHKVESFLLQANRIPGIHASGLPDPAGMPFARVRLQVEPQVPGLDAPALARALKAGQPSIWTMENLLAEGALLLELVPLTGKELQIILERIAAAMSGGTH